FYAVKGKDNYEIHVTDLASGESQKLTDLNDMYTRSLTSAPHDKRFVYTRLRMSESYIDNPSITEPAQLAVIASYDLAKKTSEDVFDFRDGEWLHFRGTGLAPMLSSSGKRVAALSFDVDRDMLMRDLDEWLSL